MANEVRLIDANALKQMFDEREAEDIELYGCHIIECFPADDAKEIVDNAPTVDAVPVVRCANCIHRVYMDLGDEAGTIGGCGLFGTAMMTCNDFCSYGQKMDGDGNDI